LPANRRKRRFAPPPKTAEEADTAVSPNGMQS